MLFNSRDEPATCTVCGDEFAAHRSAPSYRKRFCDVCRFRDYLACANKRAAARASENGRINISGSPPPDEQVVPLDDVNVLHSHPMPQTVVHWMVDGVLGNRLESWFVDGYMVTTREAEERFAYAVGQDLAAIFIGAIVHAEDDLIHEREAERDSQRRMARARLKRKRDEFFAWCELNSARDTLLQQYDEVISGQRKELAEDDQ